MILDIAPTELLVLGAVALLVIPPRDLPKAMRIAGQWMGRARGMARTFRSGFDDMIRESEFQEMEKKWKAENARIMREFPPTADQVALAAPVEPAGAHIPSPDEMTPVAVEQPASAVEAKPARKRTSKPRAKPVAEAASNSAPAAAATRRGKAKS